MCIRDRALPVHIAHLTTRRPIATSMVFLVIVFLGLVSLERLPVDLLPNISFPRLLILTQYPDVGPQEIETIITSPIEETATTVPGVRRVHSISRDGRSQVSVEFVWGTKMDFAALTARKVGQSEQILRA